MVPANESFKGNLRFSWDMVAAMLSLYRHAAHSSTRNCAPSWVHLSSERCAPITNCRSFHDSLARRPQRSRLQQEHYMPWWSPAVNASVTKVSQWSTLWMAHATALAADEERLRLTWQRLQQGTNVNLGDGLQGAGSLDEYVWTAELERRGLPFDLVGPTYYSFAQGFDGHPGHFTTREAVAQVAQVARKRGMYFARKFGYDHAVQSELLDAVRDASSNSSSPVKGEVLSNQRGKASLPIVGFNALADGARPGIALNVGADCWRACRQRTGPCSFCGPQAACCRDGWNVSFGPSGACQLTGNACGGGYHCCTKHSLQIW